MIVVGDASPLIALGRIGRLDLLRQMFGTLVVPEAVWNEVTACSPQRAGVIEVLQSSWIQRRGVSDFALAREIKADVLLIDERLGRSAARRLGLTISGLVGVLIEARRSGLLPDASQVVEDLRTNAGFWISDALANLIVNS
jgi:uncharacterized protein